MPGLTPLALFLQTAQTDLRLFLAVVITVVLSICLHELAHGFVAIRHGDTTPIDTGHMTLNPAVHMGFFSIVMLLFIGIAWGAMPVDPTRMRGKYAETWVALAGPACNVILALLALGGLGLWCRFDPFQEPTNFQDNLQFFLEIFGKVNIYLAIFNLLPVPPLDGARVLSSLSRSFADVMDRAMQSGAIFLMQILAFVAASRIIIPYGDQVAVRIFKFFSGS